MSLEYTEIIDPRLKVKGTEGPKKNVNKFDDFHFKLLSLNVKYTTIISLATK